MGHQCSITGRVITILRVKFCKTLAKLLKSQAKAMSKQEDVIEATGLKKALFRAFVLQRIFYSIKRNKEFLTKYAELTFTNLP